MNAHITGYLEGKSITEVRKILRNAKDVLYAKGYSTTPINNYISKRYYGWFNIRLSFLIYSEAIYMLSGWEKSYDCWLEKKIAERLGLEIIFEEPQIGEKVKEAIMEMLNIELCDIYTKTRKRKGVYARMILTEKLFKEGYSLARIGKEVGRDRTTLLYYLNKYDIYYKYDKKFRSFVDSINEKLL